MREWLWRVLVVMSQMVNVVLLFGHPNETVCARCYRNRHKRGWATAQAIIDIVFWWQCEHCRESHLSDRRYARQVLSKGG